MIPTLLMLVLAQTPIVTPNTQPTLEERNRQGCILLQALQIITPTDATYKAGVAAVCDGTATVPRVIGTPFRDGARALTAAGLLPIYEFPVIATTPPTPAAGFGVVAFQDPPAGTVVKLGTSVRMVISDK